MTRLRSNSSCSVPSTPDQHTKFYRKRESSLTPTHLHPKFGIDRSNSTNLLNLSEKSVITTRGRSPRQRRGAICNEGSISFFNKFFLMLNDRISLLSNRGIRNGIIAVSDCCLLDRSLSQSYARCIDQSDRVV